MKRHFTKEGTQAVNKHMKKMLNATPEIREMQLETTMTCHFGYTRMAKINTARPRQAPVTTQSGSLVRRRWHREMAQPPWKTV